MALPSRLQTISIREDEAGDNWGGSGSADWQYDLTPRNFSLDHQDVYWTGSATDEALDGSLRQNFRGYRLVFTIEWEKLTNTTVQDQVGGDDRIRYMLNDIVTSLVTNQDDGIEISFNPDEVSPDWDLFVPTRLGKVVAFNDQIARAASTLEFQSQQIVSSIPARFESPSV